MNTKPVRTDVDSFEFSKASSWRRYVIKTLRSLDLLPEVADTCVLRGPEIAHWKKRK